MNIASIKKYGNAFIETVTKREQSTGAYSCHYTDQ